MLGDIQKRLSLTKDAKQLIQRDPSQDFEQPEFAEIQPDYELQEPATLVLQPIGTQKDYESSREDFPDVVGDFSVSTDTSEQLSRYEEDRRPSIPLALIFRKQQFLESIQEQAPGSILKKEAGR